ncbi:hypothetical protein ACLIYP_22210 [Streptomyces nanhaiensis]|uniref:hypothetical protein n=1 Tax=Streptomyces nanhaiensis TaxID=679319 RepID=UPI00399C7A39
MTSRRAAVAAARAAHAAAWQAFTGEDRIPRNIDVSDSMHVDTGSPSEPLPVGGTPSPS